MRIRTAKALFLIGTAVSGVLFIALTVDTQLQVAAQANTHRLNDQVVSGKMVWHKYNCNDCHTILGFGGYYAPDLTRAYRRLGAQGIRQVIAHPDQIFASSWRHMPQQHLSSDEQAQLVAFFQWVNDIPNNNWPPQDERVVATKGGEGPALFSSKGCSGCHKIGGVGGSIGPDLTEVGASRSPDTIARIIADPKSVKPDATMPKIAMTPQERAELVKFLGGLK